MVSMLRLFLFAAALLACVSSSAHAQGAYPNYPNKPLRLIVPFAPGGSNDIMARIIGYKFAESFGQQVIIDNRGGASGIIGTDLAAKAAPDGYTLLMMSLTIAVNPSLYRKLPLRYREGSRSGDLGGLSAADTGGTSVAAGEVA